MNGYSVSYGSTNNQYGLIFSKDNTRVSIDYPTQKTVTLDGKNYDVTIDALGIVALTLARIPVVTYSVTLDGGPLAISMLQDGGFKMSWGGQDYFSEPGHNMIVLPNGTRIGLFFMNGQLSEMAVFAVDGALQLVTFAVQGGTARVTHLLDMDPAAPVLSQNTTIDYEKHRVIYQEPVLPAGPGVYDAGIYTALNMDVGMLLSFQNGFIRVAKEPSSNTDARFFAKVRYDQNDQTISKIVHWSGGKFYEVWFPASAGISTADFESLGTRTTDSLRDFTRSRGLSLVETQITVTAADGKQFRLERIEANTLFFRYMSPGALSELPTEQGQDPSIPRLLLRVPQADGTTKVYDVTIDAQGIVTLTLQPQVLAQYPVSIDAGTSVKFYTDGSYELTFAGQTYKSDANGIVVTMASAGHPSVRLQIRKNATGYDLTTLTSTGENVTRVYLEPRSGNLDPVKVERFYVGGFVQTYTFNYDKGAVYSEYEYASGGILRKVNTVYKPTLPLNQALFLRADITLSLGVAVGSLQYQGSTPTVILIGGQSLLSVGAVDVTWDKVLALPNPDAAGLKSLITDDKLVVMGQEVVLEDGTRLSLTDATLDQLTFQKLTAPQTLYNTTKTVDGKWLLTIPQSSGGNRIYDVLIDAQGIVMLTFRPTVVAEYSVAIGTETSVKLFDDGSYGFTYDGKTSISNAQGIVTLSDGTRLKVEFDSVARKPYEMNSLDDQGRVKDNWSLALVGNVYRVDHINELDTTGSVIFMQIPDYSEFTMLNGGFTSTGPTFRTFYFNKNTDLSKYLKIEGGRLGRYEPTEGANLRDLYADFFRQTGPGGFQSVRHYTHLGWTVYHVLQIGNLNVTEPAVNQLTERTHEAFMRLLQDDRWVRTESGSSPELTANDGTKFLLLNVHLNSLTWKVNPPSGLIVDTVTSADGKVTLTVPQADGSTKVYDVLIDNAGIVSLVARPAAVPMLSADGQTLMSIRLSSLVDQPYSLIYQGKEYVSDKDGYVTLDTGSKLRWSKHYLNDETLEIITPAGTSSGFVNYHFDGTAWKMTGAVSTVYVSGILRYNSVLDFSRQVIESTGRTPLGQVWQREYFVFNRSVDVSQFLVLDPANGWLRFNGMDNYKNSQLFAYIRYSQFGDIFRFQDETLGWCRVYAVGGQDVTEQQVIDLPHRTGTELRGLIVNDSVVQEL